MMGERRVMQEALFYGFSLERRVPDGHWLRKIDRFVHLTGLRAHLGPSSGALANPRRGSRASARGEGRISSAIPAVRLATKFARYSVNLRKRTLRQVAAELAAQGHVSRTTSDIPRPRLPGWFDARE